MRYITPILKIQRKKTEFKTGLNKIKLLLDFYKNYINNSQKNISQIDINDNKELIEDVFEHKKTTIKDEDGNLIVNTTTPNSYLYNNNSYSYSNSRYRYIYLLRSYIN